MLLIAVLGVVSFGGGFLRWSIVATTILYVWSASWAAVFSVALAFALTDSFRNLSRFGVRGYGRPRFWFELARTMCILGTILAVISYLFAVTGFSGSYLPSNLLVPAILFASCAFFVASTVGHAQLLVTRRRVSGRAAQCVGFFYPFCLAAIAVVGFMLVFRNLSDDPLSAIVTLVVVCLAGSLAITIKNRWKDESPPRIENAR